MMPAFAVFGMICFAIIAVVAILFAIDAVKDFLLKLENYGEAKMWRAEADHYRNRADEAEAKLEKAGLA